MPATLLPHSCRLPRPPSAHSPPSLFLKTDCPPLPAGSWGSSATHRGPIRAGGVGGSGGGLRWRGERRWQVKWLGGRGGLSFTVIQVLSGWRRGKVKWRGVPCLSSVSPLQLHLSCTMAGRLWAVSWGRRGSRGDETVAGIFFFSPLFERCSVSS